MAVRAATASDAPAAKPTKRCSGSERSNTNVSAISIKPKTIPTLRMRQYRGRDRKKQRPQERRSRTSAKKPDHQEHFARQQCREHRHHEADQVPQGQRSREIGGVEPRQWDALCDRVCRARDRRHRQRHANVVSRPQPAVLFDSVRAWFEGVATDQRGLAIVVGEIEIAIEGDRVGDDQVMRLISRAGERAVTDQTGDDDEDGDDENARERAIRMGSNVWHLSRRLTRTPRAAASRALVWSRLATTMHWQRLGNGGRRD